MATGSAVAICLRCEWHGTAPDGRPCPECGAPLYRSAPKPARARGPRPPPEPRPPAAEKLPDAPRAAILDPPESPDPQEVPVSGRRRWPVVLAALATVAAAVAVGTRGGDPAPSPRPGPAEAAAGEEPASIAGARAEVPAPLRSLLEGRSEPVTVGTMEELPDLPHPLVRLWRLDPGRGSLVPGPVIPSFGEIGSDPRPGRDRLAFVVGGGGLFLLDGFMGARPQRVAGAVRAFEFLPDGSLVYVSVVQRTARCCGGTEAVVRVGRTLPDSSVVTDRFARRTRSLTLQGATVRGTRAYVWGIQGGGHHLMELDLERRRRIERPVGGLRVVGVGPRDRLLVGLRAGIGHVSLVRPHPDGAIPSVPGFLLRQVLAWSPDGTTLATYGAWKGQEGLWVIRLGRSTPLYGTSAIGPPRTATFLLRGRLVAWTEPGHIAVADVAGRSVHRIPVPHGFPELLDPLTAG